MNNNDYCPSNSGSFQAEQREISVGMRPPANPTHPLGMMLQLSDHVRSLIFAIRRSPQCASRFSAANSLAQLARNGDNVPDDVVAQCMNLCLNVKTNEERTAAEHTLSNFLHLAAESRPKFFTELPKFFEIAISDTRTATVRGVICLAAISRSEAVLYPLRLQLAGFMKRALENTCSLEKHRGLIVAKVLHVMIKWQTRKNESEKQANAMQPVEVAPLVPEVKAPVDPVEKLENACANQGQKDVGGIKKEDQKMDSEPTIKPEPVTHPEFQDIPTKYFEQLICLLLRIGTTMDDNDAQQRQLKFEFFRLINAVLMPDFCRAEVKIQDHWFEHLMENTRTQDNPQLVAELYYTFYFLYDFMGTVQTPRVIQKVLESVETVLASVLEHKLVSVYPTAFMLITRFFKHSDAKAFGIEGAYNLSQHLMLFFRETFLRIADPRTAFDMRFLMQLRIVTNFLVTISKFQPSFVEAISMGLFIKASQRVGQNFLDCIDANIQNRNIYEVPEYINLLKSVTSIVRIISPCIQDASQEIRRNISQSVFYRVIPTQLPSHLVDHELLHFLLKAIVPLLSGPAAPSYCVPVLQRLLVFRHVIGADKELRALFAKVGRVIMTNDSLKTTQLKNELEPVLVVEQMRFDLKKARKHHRTAAQLQAQGKVDVDTRKAIEENQANLSQIMLKWFHYQIPQSLHPQHLYEIPTLMALRARAMELMEETTLDKINEMFLLAIHLVEEMKAQNQMIWQRVQEEERRVFKYYSEYLEANLNKQIAEIRTGCAVWRVDDVLDAANCALVTARALRYANAKQGVKLMHRFLRSVNILFQGKATLTCEVAKWSDYISIALDDVPLEHWSPSLCAVLKDLKKGLSGAEFINRVMCSYAYSKPREMIKSLVSAMGKRLVKEMIMEVNHSNEPNVVVYFNPETQPYKEYIRIALESSANHAPFNLSELLGEPPMTA